MSQPKILQKMREPGFWLKPAYLLLVFVLFFWVFRFQRPVEFRDLTIPSEYFKPIRNPLGPGYWISQISLTTSLKPIYIWSFLYALLSTISLFSFFSLLKILGSVFYKKQAKSNLSLTVFYSLAWIYTLNPFVLERALMGQPYVLFGHWLLPLVVLSLVVFLKEGVGVSRVFINLLLLAFVSSHHFLVIGYLFFLCFGVLFFWVFLGKTFVKRGLEVAKHVFSRLIVLFCCFLVLFSFVYLKHSDSHADYYYQSIVKTEEEVKIIKSFSLNRGSQKTDTFIVTSLAGKNSWMNSFWEVLEIEKDMSDLVILSLYNNDGLLFLLFGFAVFFLVYSFTDKSVLVLLRKFRFLLLLALTLCFGFLLFGLNPGFEFLNQIFYTFPGSYALREAGKFYSFFWLGLLSLFLISLELKKAFGYKISSLFSLFLVIAFGLPFFFLSSNYNYTTQPDIYSSFSKSCSSSKSLFLPNDSYIKPYYSPFVFIINPSVRQIDCDFANQYQATLITEANNIGLTLETNSFAADLDNSINESVESENLESFLSFIEQNRVKNILIETYFNQQMHKLNNILLDKLSESLVSSSESIYWYSF